MPGLFSVRLLTPRPSQHLAAPRRELAGPLLHRTVLAASLLLAPAACGVIAEGLAPENRNAPSAIGGRDAGLDASITGGSAGLAGSGGLGGRSGAGGLAGESGSGGLSGSGGIGATGGTGGISGSGGIIETGGIGGTGGFGGTGGIIPDGGPDAGCVAQPPIVETAFSSGTFTNLDNTSRQGSLTDSAIFLARNWSASWRAANGLPTAAAPAWTPVGLGTFPSAAVIDPISNESAIRIDTLTLNTNQQAYYTLETFTPALSNTGWTVQWRARLAGSDGVGGESLLGVVDGTWEGDVGLTSSNIVELTTSGTYSFDPQTKMNTYRFEATGTNFRIYVNENLQINGTFNSSNTATPQIRFGDIYLNQDGNSYWNSLAWYTGGDHVPYLSSGQYISRVFDLTSAANDLGSTANLSLNTLEPATTAAIFETRTGGTAAPDASWSSWVAVSAPAHTINSPANRYLQIRTNLTSADSAQTPVVNDYSINYCLF